MAGTITKLKIQKRNTERVNVYLDDAYAFAVTMNAALELKKGQHLSDAEIEQFKAQDDRDKAYHRAIRYLGYRARSRVELERYLRGKKYNPAVVTEIIERLEQEGYVDDEAFARAWVADRERLKPRSRRALRYELRQKGVGRAVIDRVVGEVDEEEMARDALQKKLYRWRRLSEEKFKHKAMGHLSRRGFNYEITRKIVDEAWAELTDTWK